MNSGYSAADIYAMQKEAEQRVFEMQRRARKTLELDKEEEQKEAVSLHSRTGDGFSETLSHNENLEHNFTAQQSTEFLTNKNEQSEGKNSEGIIGFLLQDKERALIVLLLLILIRENADEGVILVLLYLMMEPS